MQYLTITIKSFDYIYINKTCKNIQKICDFFNLNNIQFFSLPVKIKKYTVERSPHIDKKSREQFEIKKYKTNIQVQIRNKAKGAIIQHIIKNSIYPGVEISFYVEFYDFWVEKNKIR